jgi:hypothetical protein
MHETPPAPAATPAPSQQHLHMPANVPMVAIPLDYVLRLVDTAARLKYAPPPLPATAAAQAESPVDRIAGGTMKVPSPAIHIPGNEWVPKGAAASERTS